MRSTILFVSYVRTVGTICYPPSRTKTMIPSPPAAPQHPLRNSYCSRPNVQQLSRTLGSDRYRKETQRYHSGHMQVVASAKVRFKEAKRHKTHEMARCRGCPLARLPRQQLLCARDVTTNVMVAESLHSLSRADTATSMIICIDCTVLACRQDRGGTEKRMEYRRSRPAPELCTILQIHL